MNKTARLSIVALFGVLGVGILLGLGYWQQNRLEWKEGLLRDIADRQQQEAQILPKNASDSDSLLYKKYQIEAKPVIAKSLYLYGQGLEGQGIGYFPHHAFILPDGRWVIVQLGFLPLEQANNSSNPIIAVSQWQSDKALSGTFTPYLQQGFFIPDNDQDKNIWYWHDTTAIADHFGLDEKSLLPLVFISNNNFGYLTAQPNINLPNTHFQYMVTWYSLAFVWFVMSILLFRKEWQR